MVNLARAPQYINEAALAFAPRSGSQHQMVMRFVASLAENPFVSGDFSERDDAGRTVQVKVVGRFAITFGRIMRY